MNRVAGNHTWKAKQAARSPLTMLTNLKHFMSPQVVPKLYEPYLGFVGHPTEAALPINVCEQQHMRHGQYTSTLMVANQAETESLPPQFDSEIAALEGLERHTFGKQRKLGMKNNGQHGGNPERKIFSEEVGMTWFRMVEHPLVPILDAYKADPTHEIDDGFDAFNLIAACAVEMYANEAKARDPTCHPMETGACLDMGKSFIRLYGTDPGEVLHARVLADFSRLYPPRQLSLQFFYNDSDEAIDESKDTPIPLPAFRIWLFEIINLRTGKSLFKWTCPVEDQDVWYRPDNMDITHFFKAIKEGEDRRAEMIKERKREGARKAAETRKRKRAEAAFGASEGPQEPALKKPKTEDVIVIE
jgi:hypothetical protein